jgi:hypothetical protein
MHIVDVLLQDVLLLILAYIFYHARYQYQQPVNFLTTKEIPVIFFLMEYELTELIRLIYQLAIVYSQAQLKKNIALSQQNFS